MQDYLKSTAQYVSQNKSQLAVIFAASMVGNLINFRLGYKTGINNAIKPQNLTTPA